MEVDALAVQITGFFLLWAAGGSLPFLAHKAGYKRGWIPLSPWIFLLIAFGLLGACAVFIALAGAANLLLGIALGVGVTLSFFHPMVAVSFFVANLLMRPWELLPYNEFISVMPRLMAGVATLTWIFHRFRARNATIVWGFTPWTFTALLGWIAIATMVSATAQEDLPVLFKNFLPIYVLVLLILNSVKEPEDMRLLKDTITLSVTGIIATAIVITVRHPQFLDGGRRLETVGLMGNANDLGAMIALAAPFPALAILRRERSLRGRMADLLCLGILMVGVLLSQSRGAILAITAAGAGYALIMSKSFKKTLIRGGAIAVVPLLLMTAIDRDSGDLEGSSSSRFNYMITGIKMMASNPITGVGMNNYPRLYEKYTSEFTEWGERTAHSTWVLFMSETGLIGLMIFVVLYFTTFARAWHFRTVGPEYILSMISYGVAMSFLSHSYSFFPYLIIFTVAAATRVHSKGALT